MNGVINQCYEGIQAEHCQVKRRGLIETVLMAITVDLCDLVTQSPSTTRYPCQ